MAADILVVSWQKYLRQGIERQFAHTDFGVEAVTDPPFATWRLINIPRPYRIALLDVHERVGEPYSLIPMREFADTARSQGIIPLLLMGEGMPSDSRDSISNFFSGAATLRFSYASESSPLLEPHNVIPYLVNKPAFALDKPI